MVSTQPATFLILPSALSSISIPKFPDPISSILPIIPLHHHQPSSTSASSTNNLPPCSTTNHIPHAKQYQHQPTQSRAKPTATPPPQQAQKPPQQTENFPTHGTILTITGGSNTDLETKRQRMDYYRQVNHVPVEGPITLTKWSHILIIFSSQDINLTSFPHTDAMIVTVHIDRWDVTKILIDNSSQAEILFLTTFDKMGFHRKQLREPSKPLYGFGGKRIEPIRAITLLVSFGTPKNPALNTSPSMWST
jgi:hypothetical protein